MMSDLELIKNEKGLIEGKRWEAIYDSSIHFFTARNKREATRVANEYAERISGETLLAVYEA